MVLAERNTENIRNGRRSRGPSPNGHGGTNESSSDDDSGRKIGNAKTKTKSDYEEKIRVGRDYQVVCPELIPPPERKPEILPDKALLVWSPTKDIPDTQLEEYITVAKEKYGYNGEQALGMLFWHKHDLERAVLDLANFTPFPDEWTVEDKVLFEQAFQFHGKRFHQIRQMLPDKSIASLVKFYYSWKKTRSRTSVMDRQDKKKAEGSENGSENGSNEESDNEDKKWPLHRGIHRSSRSPPRAANIDPTVATPPNQDGSSVQNGQINGIVNKNANEKTPPTISSASSETSCSSCGVACHHVYKISNIGRLCGSCHTHWQRTGNLRPTSGPMASKRSRHMDEKHTRKPPRGIHINHDDIVALACPEQCDQTNGSGDLLAGMDRGLVSVLSQMQQNKQSKSTLLQSSTDLKITQVESFNRTSRWNNEELLLGVQGVKKFGKDFLAIADTIATKTEAQVRTFFVNYRRRYNLDIMLAEYEAANNSQAKIRTPSTDAPVVMEIDLVNDDDTNTKETVSIS